MKHNFVIVSSGEDAFYVTWPDGKDIGGEGQPIASHDIDKAWEIQNTINTYLTLERATDELTGNKEDPYDGERDPFSGEKICDQAFAAAYKAQQCYFNAHREVLLAIHSNL